MQMYARIYIYKLISIDKKIKYKLLKIRNICSDVF